MADSIKKRIIDAILLRAANVRRSYGFKTDIGKNIELYRVVNRTVPAISIWPEFTEITDQYKIVSRQLRLKIEGIVELEVDDDYHSIIENIEADIIEAMTGTVLDLDFTSGGDGTNVPEPGHEVVGEVSGTTGIIESVTVDSGAWGSSDAAGQFRLRRVFQDFTSETLEINGISDMATIPGTMARTASEDLACGGLVEDIILIESGNVEYPEQSEVIAGCSAVFGIVFSTDRGNPYKLAT